MFAGFSNCCAVTDSLTGNYMLPDMENIIATTPAMTAVCVVGESCAVDALAVVLTVVIIGSPPAIDVGTLAAENLSILASVVAPFGFTLSEPVPCSCAAFSCWPTPILDTARVLQACMPSCHVCWSLVFPAPPQVLNQEPPRPQQLALPDFTMVPHLGHSKPMVVFRADVCMGG